MAWFPAVAGDASGRERQGRGRLVRRHGNFGNRGPPERRLPGLRLDFALVPELLPSQFLDLRLQLTPDPRVRDADLPPES